PVTTLEPGANDVLTYSGTFKPFSTAFLATKQAPNITYGFDVFVQDVIAAIARSPVVICVLEPSLNSIVAVLSNSLSSKPCPWLPAGAVTDFSNSSFISLKKIKSCGRFGPESEASTVAKSNSTTSV